MTEALIHSNFVAPHYIEELGEEGLTLHEIAKSLGITFGHSKAAYEKNISDYSGIEISTPSGNPVNPTVLSYALTTEDAKFFVAGYNNDIGKAYRRYLIQCEKAVHKLAQQVRQITPQAKAEEIVGVWSRVGDLFGVPKHLAQIEAVKEAHRRTGVDFSPLLQLTPAQDNIPDEEEMLEPTELAAKFGFKNAIVINRTLEKAGLQTKKSGKWTPTEKGKGMCTKHAWKSGSKSGYNLKWNVKAVAQVLSDGDDFDR